LRISDVRGYEILDSRGTPTVEAVVALDSGEEGRYSVPSGASTGKHEAVELRDGENERYGGLGTRRAVAHVCGPIREALVGQDPSRQDAIDELLCRLDGTPNKARLGANALLAVSVASAKAASTAGRTPLHEYIGGPNAKRMPVPLFNVLNGGKHADSGLDVQEFMLAPFGAATVVEAIRCGVEVYRSLRKLLLESGHRVSVGDEGGFAPQLSSNEEALSILVTAIERAGYRPKEDVGIVLDVAATEFFRDGAYHLAAAHGQAPRSSDELVQLYGEWVHRFPIVGIEDGLAEDDWEGWTRLTDALRDTVTLIGDDLFVTNTTRLATGVERKAGTGIIIKPNQIGTLSETIETVRLAQKNDYTCVMANRSGETTDSFIANLAVALGTPAIKTGAPCRGERVSKYNELICIETDLRGASTYFGRDAFPILRKANL
jgi:enolase